MKVGIILVLLIAYSATISISYAEEFDIRLIPSKIVENSDGIMQVFISDGANIEPTKITDLTVTSLDSSILHIEKVKESDSSFITEVYVKTGKPGTTTIYLAAPDFTSKEIPITVYGNKNTASKLLVKITPDIFTTSGINEGYISVELADDDGFPVIAKEDTVISLSTADREIVDLVNSNMVIKKGDYFTHGKFHAKKSGESVIYATAQGIETQSSSVTVKEDEDLTIKSYVYPKTLSIHDAPKGFIIAQLQDSSGRPVIAQKDITVFYQVADSDYSESTNISNNYIQKTSGYFQINKGSYWGFTQYSLPQGIEDAYDVSISSEDPLVFESEEVEARDLELMDDKLVQFETVPILTTGKSELIGVVHLEDEDGNPIIAKKDLTIKIDSSDLDSISVNDVTISRGDQAALVYGRISHSVPSDLQLRPIVNEGEFTSVDSFGPDTNSLELIVEPLISEVLAGSNFPLVFYLKDGDEVTNFSEDDDVFMSPNDYVKIQPKKILSKDNLVLIDAKSVKKGIVDLNFEVGDFKASPIIDNLSSEQASIVLDHSKTIFAGTNDVFAVQILNSAGQPTFANEDVEINVIVKNQALFEMPSKVTIEKGKYYSLFDVAPKGSGETEVSLLAKEMPLATEKISVTSATPVLLISSPTNINATDTLIATLSANANSKALVGMNVKWEVSGGYTQISDSTTSPTGEAAIMITPQKNPLVITATVSGSWYSSATISKTISVNNLESIVITNVVESESYKPFEVYGIDPVMIIIPSAIGIVGFLLKKNGQLKIKK
ncbi:MAG: hypothetical protein HZA84_00920 [Thaumarchaeota archaeon]|nr:hypothetical protein [Nitrososphaerota archaeon]